VHGNYYGTSSKVLHKIIDKGKIPLLIVDLLGGKKLFDKSKDFNYVFINMEDLSVMTKRLLARARETEK